MNAFMVWALTSFLFILSSCSTNTDLLNFSCTSGKKFEYVGKSESIDFLRKNNNKINIYTSPDLTPDGGVFSLDIFQKKDEFKVDGFLLIESRYLQHGRWSDKNTSCSIVDGSYSAGVFSFKCRSNGGVGNYIFEFSKDRGITSIQHECQNCGSRPKLVLRSSEGLAKPCQNNKG